MTIGKEPFPGFPPPNSFLVKGANTSVLIDAGWDAAEDHAERMAYLRGADALPLSEVIITHRHQDHGGGAMAIQEETSAALSCHPLEREHIERERFEGNGAITRELHGGETMDLGGLTLQVLFGPGHTNGCLAVYVPERQALFTTDTVMGVSTTVIRVGQGSLVDYARTLTMFQTLDLRVMYPGHGGPINNPQDRLKTLIEHRKRREAELLRELEDGPRTVEHLRKKLYIGLPESRLRLAEAQIVTGLTKLMDEGLVQEADVGYALRK